MPDRLEPHFFDELASLARGRQLELADIPVSFDVSAAAYHVTGQLTPGQQQLVDDAIAAHDPDNPPPEDRDRTVAEADRISRAIMDAVADRLSVDRAAFRAEVRDRLNSRAQRR